MSLDHLEGQLRRLPGVTFVAFSELSGSTLVQVLSDGSIAASAVREPATALCESHLGTAFILDLGPVGRPPRIQLLEVESAFEDEVIVHLGFRGVWQSGRCEGSDPMAAAAATFEALTNLGASVPFSVEAAALFEHPVGDGVMVVLDSKEAGPRYGVASGENQAHAAARATLHALNRFLATQPLPRSESA